ncbi:hypothetical protein PS732_02455 [Pseudomonas fluorescens]|uniref:DUF2335 domain-containing protein n=1 Tax=Pseudomonas fluorescens TaxID=294 RepID=A0ABD7VFI3_PSEFL|nr:hypothetical protein [Pseudomonas fluorescens]VVO92974.1 hypothetical protein PS732_02455 [Pseudomonas fluorescens]
MSETKNYTNPHQTQNTAEWMTAGVVIASPSSGQIKALMPMFNSYSDIRIEQIFQIDEDTLGPGPSKTPERTKAIEVSFSSLSDNELSEHHLSAILHEQDRTPAQKSIWRSMMKHATSVDMRDLSIMVGLASLLGALTNMLYSFSTGSAAPQVVVIAVTALGFISGRFVSHKLRTEHHE